MSGETGVRHNGLTEPLDCAAIARAAAGFDGKILCLDTVDSTNARLLAEFGQRRVLLAEFQRAGRGRRGRCWIMPPGAGIALSFGYRFACGLAGLGALSLELGLAVAEALAGLAPVRVKWPNDLLVGERKLGGLLVEARGRQDGAGEVVIGLGVNCHLPRNAAGTHALPDQPFTDVASVARLPVGRNALAGRLIIALDTACGRVERGETHGLAERWARFDALAGARVTVQSGMSDAMTGVARGVSDAGALRLLHNGEVIEIQAGEVSLRAR